jgi:hypothetical protein
MDAGEIGTAKFVWEAIFLLTDAQYRALSRMQQGDYLGRGGSHLRVLKELGFVEYVNVGTYHRLEPTQAGIRAMFEHRAMLAVQKG